jgi:hypothetical protein
MNKNKLVTAYTDFMKHLHETMEDTLHSFAEALEISKEKAGKTSDLTKDELDKVSGFVKRDVEHAAHGLTEKRDSDSLSEWFKFDIELIENFALDAFLSLADKTRVELAKIGQIAKTRYPAATSQGLALSFVTSAARKLPSKHPVKSQNALNVTIIPLYGFDITSVSLIMRLSTI